MSSIDVLRQWAPYLLGGVPLNLLMAVTAMLIGTVLGGLLAWGRHSHRPTVATVSRWFGRIALSSPTMVLQFYLAVMLPADWGVPPWLKASMALSVAAVGFCADQFENSWTHWRAGRRVEAWVMLVSWTQFGLIILLATTTASLIGVPELLSRCQRVIQTPRGSESVFAIYAFATLVFWCLCVPMHLLMGWVKALLIKN
jgi:polar amino acid transport system permease protein